MVRKWERGSHEYCASTVYSEVALTEPIFVQAPALISIDRGPRLELTLRNDFAKVSEVEFCPGGSIAPHRHDQDKAAITNGE